ncbi:hypothetical protein HDV03_002776 [Kappamyces sp. JEL0829]|nr:hypothetical protein HDV03_002776 [Kappamyces sp. JEL0829]KAJ3358758.1 hypothetical protein HDU91_005120 [Kappamyces sp. JEL0680]
MEIKVEFGGGLELLFEGKKSMSLTLDASVQTLHELIHWIKDNRLKERQELFIQDNTIRPGILVLVNDADWELEGQEQYRLQPGDCIVFISTLHGG